MAISGEKLHGILPTCREKYVNGSIKMQPSLRSPHGDLACCQIKFSRGRLSNQSGNYFLKYYRWQFFHSRSVNYYLRVRFTIFINSRSASAGKPECIVNGFGWFGKLHRMVEWTTGCIAVTNLERRYFRRYRSWMLSRTFSFRFCKVAREVVREYHCLTGE